MNSKYEYTHLRYDPEIGWSWETWLETNIQLKCFRPTKIEDLEYYVARVTNIFKRNKREDK